MAKVFMPSHFAIAGFRPQHPTCHPTRDHVFFLVPSLHIPAPFPPVADGHIRDAPPHDYRRDRRRPDRKLILDCKYYQEALVSRYDALRFRSGNLYQLNAYLTNKAVEPGWENVEGMLLYPSNG